MNALKLYLILSSIVMIIGMSLILYEFCKPRSIKNVKWSIFTLLHKSKLKRIQNKLDESEYFHMNISGKDYVVVFMYDWMFHIYEGKTSEEIQFKYDLGGCSIKSDLIQWWERIIGMLVCNYYKNELREVK